MSEKTVFLVGKAHRYLNFIIIIIIKEDLKLIMRTLSNPKIFDDISLLDPVLNCDSWETLMTFTRESARKFDFPCISFKKKARLNIIIYLKPLDLHHLHHPTEGTSTLTSRLKYLIK